MWNAVREYWIDTYLGPPEWIVPDAGKKFASAEFRHSARLMTMNIEEVSVEAHQSVEKVERYHVPLRRAEICVYPAFSQGVPHIATRLPITLRGVR